MPTCRPHSRKINRVQRWHTILKPGKIANSQCSSQGRLGELGRAKTYQHCPAFLYILLFCAAWSPNKNKHIEICQGHCKTSYSKRRGDEQDWNFRSLRLHEMELDQGEARAGAPAVLNTERKYGKLMYSRCPVRLRPDNEEGRYNAREASRAGF